MNTTQALEKLADVVRRKHLSLSTEQSYCGWLKRYCAHIQKLPPDLSSEQKLEQFLTALAKNDVAASTQNQAFNAIIFFYKEVAGQEHSNRLTAAPRAKETFTLARADAFWPARARTGREAANRPATGVQRTRSWSLVPPAPSFTLVGP